MDRELVERARNGDESAFAALAVRIGDSMYSTAFHILRDVGRAEDAAQQAIIDIWRHLPELKDPERFQGWAYRIVVRAAYAEARQRRSWALRDAAVPRERAVAADHASAVADRDQLSRGFERLPIEQRTVLVLKHYAGLSNEEIADVIEIPEGTVRSRLHHSIRALRAALEADARPGRTTGTTDA